MSESSVRVELQGAIARVTLNRPDRRNSFDGSMIGEVGAMTVGSEGALYFATDTALVRLTCPRCRE